ncbi:hypothetical protein Y032_0152g2887 [Ancylostoma ceylanicum]|uniref:Uncharacterized protein n=1 Tax=Ancylostoma ceylanicum TaxID=53326 RepID=A0A016T0M3_9BILA|nr:hypothetical protein Y032_0152g2887 [Ancylostoma ceylanicum]
MLGREIEKAKELRYNISEQIDKDRLVPAYKNRIILWSRINISYNHMQFLTNEFEEDYQFSGVFEYKGRIIVYGHNVSNVLFFERFFIMPSLIIRTSLGTTREVCTSQEFFEYRLAAVD